MWQIDQGFVREGVALTGTVTEKRVNRSGDSTSYVVQYVYTATDGREYRGSDSVGSDFWSRLRAGDPVELTYRQSRPSESRLAQDGQPIGLFILMFGGLGGLATLLGAAILGSAARRRMGGGSESPTVARDAHGRYRFQRPLERVVIDLLGAPIVAVLFLGVAWLMLTGVFGTGGDVLAAVLIPLLFGFFGMLLAIAALMGLRRGVRRTVMEIGADGIWTPEMGRLAWSEIEQVRFEYMSATPSIPGGTLQAARLGILPRDRSLAERDIPSRLARGMMGGFMNLLRSVGPNRRLAWEDWAPFGVQSYELKAPLSEVAARIGEYTRVVDARPEPEQPSLDAAVATLAAPRNLGDRPLGAAELQALDARLAIGVAELQPAPAGALGSETAAAEIAWPPSASPAGARTIMSAPIIIEPDAAGTGSAPGAVFVRPPGGQLAVLASAVAPLTFVVLPLIMLPILLIAALDGGLLIALPFLVVPLLFVAIGVPLLLAVPSRIRRAFGASQMLGVGPDGLWLPETGLIPWADIEEIKVEGYTVVVSDDHDSSRRWRLGVRPRDESLAGRRPWSLRVRDAILSRTARLPFVPRTPLPFGVEADQLSEPLDHVVGVIRRYHPVLVDDDG